MSDQLLCPVCPNTPLQVIPFHDVDVDVCPRCDGIWFDFGEMYAIAQSDSTENIDTFFRGTFKPAHTIIRDKGVVVGPDRQCPVDRRPLERHEFGGDSKIVMDFCSFCKGTWMDAGELEGYAEYLDKSEESVENFSNEAKAALLEFETAFNQQMDQARREFTGAIRDKKTERKQSFWGGVFMMVNDAQDQLF